MISGPIPDRFFPQTLTLLRLFAGFVIWQIGAQKWLALFGERAGASFWLAGMLEFFGGILLAAGLFTRPVAVLLAVEMIVVYFAQHLSRGFWPIRNGGEPALLLFFICLFLASAGPGWLSLDGLLARTSGKR